MTFKLLERDVCLVTVRGELTDAQGNPAPFDFSLLCKRLGVEAYNQAVNDPAVSGKDFMHQVAEDWRDVSDPNGQPLPFSTEGLNQLLDVPGVLVLALTSYQEEVGARAKN